MGFLETFFGTRPKPQQDLREYMGVRAPGGSTQRLRDSAQQTRKPWEYWTGPHLAQGLNNLGDAVLDFVTASFLFQRYPEMDEGQLTRLRAALVRTEQLADLADRLEIGVALRMGKGAHDLSEMFTVRNVYRQKCENDVRRLGAGGFRPGVGV